MPNLQMLNLADVYAKADQATAMQQQATLRDLQTQQLLNQQRQDVGLSELAKRSFNSQTGEMDLNAMSRGAAEMGAYKPAMEFQEKATEAKAKKQTLTKEQANIMGQLADEKVVNDEQTYQRWLGQLNEFDPKAAQSFSQKFPNYSREAEPLLRQIGQQGMTSYQRQNLDVLRTTAQNKANKETDNMKASDTNAINANAARVLGFPFTTNPVTGEMQLGRLNPGQQQQFMALTELAATIRKNTGAAHAPAVNEAARRLRSVMPEIPAIPDYSNLLDGGQPSGPKLPSPTVGPNKGPVPIRSQAQWDALPSGSKYLRSDGQVATKP